MPDNSMTSNKTVSAGTEDREKAAFFDFRHWRDKRWRLSYRGAGVLLRRASLPNARILWLWPLRAAALYRGIAILTLNALVFFVGFELAAKSGVKISNLISSPASEFAGEGNPREKVSYYSSQDWAQRYWYEFRLSRKQRYYPYLGWRRAPFKGKTINVDQNGIRVTPGADCRDGSFKVFAFGESSMWGTGSPDWGTIPANLQKGLAKMRQEPVCVVNFAESAYVSTQDVIMLLMQLQSGNRPDWVLFYNMGDIYAAYQSGRAGVIQNLDQIAAKFETAGNQATLIDRLRSTSSYSLIARLVGKVTVRNSEQKEAAPDELMTYETMGIGTKQLSDSIVQTYLENYRIVNALSEKYGFKFLFLLPPNRSWGNKRLTIEEKEMKFEEDSDPALSKLFTAVYQSLESEALKHQNMYSMTNVFDNSDGLMWIDGGHATPVGNEVIARRILDMIQARSHDFSGGH
jgi:hypothetical protein